MVPHTNVTHWSAEVNLQTPKAPDPEWSRWGKVGVWTHYMAISVCTERAVSAFAKQTFLGSAFGIFLSLATGATSPLAHGAVARKLQRIHVWRGHVEPMEETAVYECCGIHQIGVHRC